MYTKLGVAAGGQGNKGDLGCLDFWINKNKCVLTNAQSRFVVVVLDGVLGHRRTLKVCVCNSVVLKATQGPGGGHISSNSPSRVRDPYEEFAERNGKD